MSVNSKMTAIANEIRTLSGTSGAIGLDAMATQLGNANDEADTQTSLISQIQTALRGKAAAGPAPAEPVLQDKTVTPTTSTQTVTADDGYDGLETVTVEAMPTAIQATPSITVSSRGLITASATQDAGYVFTGTKSATRQLTTQSAKTITPLTSAQTAVESRVYTIGTITVAAIPSQYIVPSGTLTVTENGTHDITNYAFVDVNVANSSTTSTIYVRDTIPTDDVGSDGDIWIARSTT